ncbi:conserved Plasmodium protein, unknown function [Plasmodium ovale]|uniref:GYF domain-containing protein n=1 Tax=Plasmodium ovale TaxID=36330 RepID=A0A1D3TG65_PLAOA|nr:conserved Plasmodium protein, unknown function [Plasmodium ovale]
MSDNMLNEESVEVDLARIEKELTTSQDDSEKKKKKKKKVHFSEQNETIYYEKDENENSYFNFSLNNFNYFECFYNEMYNCDFDENEFKNDDTFLNGGARTIPYGSCKSGDGEEEEDEEDEEGGEGDDKGEGEENTFENKNLSNEKCTEGNKIKKGMENGFNPNDNLRTGIYNNRKNYNLKRERFHQSFNEDCSFEINDIHTAITNAEEKTTHYSKDYFGYDIEPFNMKNELKEGYIDKNGNYIFNEIENDDIEEAWLKSIDEQDPFSTFSNNKLRTKMYNETVSKFNDSTKSGNNSFLTVNIYDALYSLSCLLIDNETPVKAMIRYKNDLKLCKNYLNECKRKLDMFNSLSMHTGKEDVQSAHANAVNKEESLENMPSTVEVHHKKNVLQVNIKRKDYLDRESKTENSAITTQESVHTGHPIGENASKGCEENEKGTNTEGKKCEGTCGEGEKEEEIKDEEEKKKDEEEKKKDEEEKKKDEEEKKKDEEEKKKDEEEKKKDEEEKKKDEEEKKKDEEEKKKDEEEKKKDEEEKKKDEEEKKKDEEEKKKDEEEKKKDEEEKKKDEEEKKKDEEEKKKDEEEKKKDEEEKKKDEEEKKKDEEEKKKDEEEKKKDEEEKKKDEEEISNKKTEEISNKKTEEISNEKTGEITNEKTEEISNKKTEEISNKKTEEISNEKTDEISNEKTDEMDDESLGKCEEQNNKELIDNEKMKELQKLEEAYQRVTLDYKTIERRFNNIIDLTQKLTNEYKNVYFLTKGEFEALCKKLEEYKENIEIMWQFKWHCDVNNNIYGPYSYYDIYNLISVGIVSAANPIELRRINNENKVLENIWQMYDAVNYLTFVSNENVKKKRKLKETNNDDDEEENDENDVEEDEEDNPVDDEYDIKKKKKRKKGLIQISKKKEKSNNEEDSDNEDDFENYNF